MLVVRLSLIIGTAILPVLFYSDEDGQYECHVVLRSNYDVRVLVIETTVLARGRHAHLQFDTHALQSVTQDIPLVNSLWLIIIHTIL